MSENLAQKVVCVALNHKPQLMALASEFEQPPYKAAPTEPVLYFKPHNTWAADGDTIAWPGELVVGASLVLNIGKTCRRLNSDNALSYVSGVSLMHDFSLPEKSYYRPDIKGKCLDGSATFCHQIIEVNTLADIQALEVSTEINGQVQQRLAMTDLQRDAEQLLEKISAIMTLEPGDKIAIGFYGQRLPLQQGDTVSSRVGNLVLTNRVEA